MPDVAHVRSSDANTVRVPATEVARDNSWGAALVIDALVAAGVRHVVIAPGSRSTPLVAACARETALVTHVVHDERSGAFIALGIARATAAPAALLVTSGTALANALPAVVESDCDRVPLVILSADRPPEAHGSDANQTIDQQCFFGARARAFVNIEPPEDLLDADDAWARVAACVDAARGPCPGPVHVNAMFRKPLEPRAGVKFTRPVRVRAPSSPRTDGDVVDPRALHALAHAERGLVVLGAAADADERASMERLARAMPWPVVVEALSGLRAAALPRARVAWALLAKSGVATPRADVVLWLGGALVSPELLLVVSQARVVVRLEDRQRRPPEHAHMLAHVDASPDALVAHASSLAPVADDAHTAEETNALAVLEAERTDDSGPLTEPFVAMCTAASAVMHEALFFVGNSMPVRDVELFAGPHVPAVIANRGASGIDGLLSTAAGVALGSARPVVALIGDVSFLHDAGSLSAIARMGIRLRVVVVVNGGGGIFDFLPIRAHEDLLRPFFTTPHTVEIDGVARAYGVRPVQVSDRATLVRALAAPIETCEIVVVNVAGRDNVADHRALYRRVAHTCSLSDDGNGA